jgi:protein required for attachment to host cells
MRQRGMMVLAGDGRTALLFDNRGTTLHPACISAEVCAPRTIRQPAQGTGRPGRSFQSVGSRRSALEQTDWHRLSEERFARAIAVALEELHTTRTLREIMLFAPPHFLSYLRAVSNRKHA